MEEMLVIALCLTLNALLAAYEMAFVSVPQMELKKASEKGSRAAKRLLKLRGDPERTLSIIQIGITLVGAVSAAVSGAGASEELAPLIAAKFGLSEQVSEAISIGVVVIPLTYLSVVIGELVPKSIALRHPLRITLLGSRALFIADRVLSPIVTVLESSTKLILSLIFAYADRKAQREQKAQELAGAEDLADPSTVDVENLPSHHRQAILNLAHLERRTLRDIILPWKDTITLKHSATLEDAVTLVFASGHTRIPVLDEDKVVGILHTKEFLALREAGGKDWHSAIRPALYMRSNDLILTTLRIMQAKRSHLAVIVTKKQDPIGIVTMEDISEEIWGEIYDEDDDSRIRKIFADRVRRKAFHERRT